MRSKYIPDAARHEVRSLQSRIVGTRRFVPIPDQRCFTALHLVLPRDRGTRGK